MAVSAQRRVLRLLLIAAAAGAVCLLFIPAARLPGLSRQHPLRFDSRRPWEGIKAWEQGSFEGKGQGQGQEQGQVQRQGKGQGLGQGQEEGQGHRRSQGQGLEQGQGQEQGQKEGQGQGQRQEQGQAQAQGEGQGQEEVQGREQEQVLQENEGQGQMQAQGELQNQAQGQERGQEEDQGQEEHQRKGQAQREAQGQIKALLQDQQGGQEEDQGREEHQGQGQAQREAQGQIKALLQGQAQGQEGGHAEGDQAQGQAEDGAPPVCPGYFRFMKEDLEPWRARGISLEALEGARRAGASFLVLILSEQLYVEDFQPCYQTRALFTIFGLLHFLDRYPGRIPDVALMFNCEDFASVPRGHTQGQEQAGAKKEAQAQTQYEAKYLAKEQNQGQGEGQDEAQANAGDPGPPIMVTYCSSAGHLDLVWPDWSFWGWPEVSLRPWAEAQPLISRASRSQAWGSKIPRAHWKGATWVGPHLRGKLVECTDAPRFPWGVEAYDTKWLQEKDTNSTRLEAQCIHKYKIYVEGTTWSCSLKYILACGATTLLVKPTYYEFFSRGLKENEHYITVPPPWDAPLCPSLKTAISSLEASPEVAERLADEALAFVTSEISMDRVYDYMFHFIQEYSKMQAFLPDEVPHEFAMLVDLASLVRRHPFLKDYVPTTMRKSAVCTMEYQTDAPAGK